MKIGIYAGSFDPATWGHLGIIEQAAGLFDVLHVEIGVNPKKSRTFDVDQSLGFMQRMLDDKGITNVTLGQYQGLLIHRAMALGAHYIVRGLRAASDFEAEFTMNGVNNKLAPDIQTLFFMAPEKFMFVASSTVKEIARFGGGHDDLCRFVPPFVAEALIGKFAS
jgi:pantetheine-phosphate adenylyltransferase